MRIRNFAKPYHWDVNFIIIYTSVGMGWCLKYTQILVFIFDVLIYEFIVWTRNLMYSDKKEGLIKSDILCIQNPTIKAK